MSRNQAKHWYIKDGGGRGAGEAVILFIDQKQFAPITVAELSDVDFNSKLSFTPGLPKIVL